MAATEEESVGDVKVPMSDELSRRRTGLSFQRTRLSADRTLMSVIRTALSLISFGFTINQVIGKLKDADVARGGPNAARNFGFALILLGVASLVLGIMYHLFFMRGLRNDREELVDEGLLRGKSIFPVSATLIVAVCLLVIGVLAIASIGFRSGPFE